MNHAARIAEEGSKIGYKPRQLWVRRPYSSAGSVHSHDGCRRSTTVCATSMNTIRVRLAVGYACRFRKG